MHLYSPESPQLSGQYTSRRCGPRRRCGPSVLTSNLWDPAREPRGASREDCLRVLSVQFSSQDPNLGPKETETPCLLRALGQPETLNGGVGRGPRTELHAAGFCSHEISLCPLVFDSLPLSQPPAPAHLFLSSSPTPSPPTSHPSPAARCQT